MLPSSVAKCMTTNYDAIIYDHDHSKRINDHLRCRRDNGATCLNCKVDFLLEMANRHLACPSSPPPPLPPHIFLKCKQSESVNQLVHLPPALPISPRRPASESFRAPWDDQRQLCDTLWGTQEAENIKPQTWKRTESPVQVCGSVCAINKWIN